MELNDAERTVTFKRVSFHHAMTGNFAAGFGESVRISGTVDFEFFDTTELDLESGQNNEFSVNGFSGGNGNLNGKYELSGPTETVSGTFTSSAWYRGGNPTIDTSNYPGGLTMSGGEWSRGSFINIFNGTVDGADISVGISRATYYTPFDFEFQNAGIIPEPSEYALMIGGLLIAFIAFRRRGFLKSG